MSDFILGTAGHIDHGKTTLIKALTNINTDRLKEEQERGITIELGFAYLNTPSNKTIGIIDVPGHEKFIKNMVAGVYGINVVMLIIAADEGIMPQTIEHIEICELLGIKKGIIALTKTDMVESDFKELVLEEIDNFKQNTFLKNAPIFTVSSKTSEGIEKLKNYIFKLAASTVETPQNGYFVLPIDRVFTMKGFGTVVTGTTISGEITLGDDVEVLPSNLIGKVRTIQVHGKQVETIKFGHRTAINIQGISKNEINRGDILTIPNYFNTTDILLAKLKYLQSNKKPLKNRIQVKFHSGTASIPAKVIIIDKNEILPGESCFAQFFLEKKIFNTLGDRYIIRSFDDKRTLGGGLILDSTGIEVKRLDKENIHYLKVLDTGSTKEKIGIIIDKFGKYGISLKKIIEKVNLKKNILVDILKNLEIVIFDKNNFLLISKNNLESLTLLTVDIIEKFHKNNPKSQGISLEEVKNKINENLNYHLFQLIIDYLLENNKINLSNGIISLKIFSIKLNQKDEENKNIISENRYLIDKLKQKVKMNRENKIVVNPLFLQKIKRFNDFVKKTKNIEMKAKDIFKELKIIKKELNKMQQGVFVAKIISHSGFPEYNRIEFSLIEPPVKLDYDTKDIDEYKNIFRLKDYGEMDYKIIGESE